MPGRDRRHDVVLAHQDGDPLRMELERQAADERIHRRGGLREPVAFLGEGLPSASPSSRASGSVSRSRRRRCRPGTARCGSPRRPCGTSRRCTGGCPRRGAGRWPGRRRAAARAWQAARHTRRAGTRARGGAGKVRMADILAWTAHGGEIACRHRRAEPITWSLLSASTGGLVEPLQILQRFPRGPARRPRRRS